MTLELCRVLPGIEGRNKYISIVGTVRFLLPVFLWRDHPCFHFTFSDGRTKVAGALDKMGVLGAIRVYCLKLDLN